MDHAFGIAGFSDLIGFISAILCAVAVGVLLQRVKGPPDREPQA
jgi:hypothetical protein